MSEVTFGGDAPASPASELCRHIVEVGGIAVLIHDHLPPHTIRFANSVAEALIGHPAEGLIGRPLGETIKLAGHAPRPALLQRLTESLPCEVEVTTP